MNSHLDITQPTLPLTIAFPDSACAVPQWITSQHDWGQRAPYLPDDLGEWIWAPIALENAPFELLCEFEIPDNRGVVGAYVTGAVLDENSMATVAINGVIGNAGGQIETRGELYRAFEGEVSPWLHAGINRIAIQIKPTGEDREGCVLRLIIRYADGGEDVIITDKEWRARVWDGLFTLANRKSREVRPLFPWSETLPVRVFEAREVPAEFIKPRLYSSEWPAPLLRREFELPMQPRRAILSICGLGCYEASLNGERIGDSLLDPAQTTYEERAFYSTYDVTHQLTQGKNALGVILGHGWYGQNLAWTPHISAYGKPAALVQLEIEDENGVRVIVSDENWQAAPGPTRADNLYRGEIYDARCEISDWNRAGTIGGDWHVVEIVPPLSPQLEPQIIPPIRRQEEIAPVGLTEPKPKLWVFDIGENIVGWAQLRVNQPAGTRIKLRFAEALNPDGTLDFQSTGPFATRVVQEDIYLCKGGELEIWEPRFTYHGFQYVEISGLTETPTLETIRGIVIHTDLADAGSWRSSDETLNAIEKISRRSLVGNLHGIITDCPHRERCQWQADAEIISDYALYRYQAAPIFAKCLDDSATTLDGAGLPREINVGRRTPPLIDIGWSTLAVQVAWRIRLFTGDLQPARAHYDLMRFICDYYHNAHPDGIVPTAGHGDHAAPLATHDGELLPECPRDGYATTLLFESTQTLAKLAKHLGCDDDARNYNEAAAKVHEALIVHFYDEKTGGYAHPTLDAYALLLDLFPDGARPKLIEHFRGSLRHHDWMNVGGFFGYRRIAEAAILFLPQDEALKVLTQSTQPGIAYAIARGATSIWEQYYPDSDPNFRMRSLNHYAYGAVCENFWRHIAGIAPDEDAPGFRRIVLAPHLTNTLQFADATHQSPHGHIRSAWQRDENGWNWQIAIPRGAMGRAVVPLTNGAARVTAGGEDLSKNSAIQIVNSGAEKLELELAAGNYQLRVN